MRQICVELNSVKIAKAMQFYDTFKFSSEELRALTKGYITKVARVIYFIISLFLGL